MAAAAWRSTGEVLLQMLDEAYQAKSWHGPNLRNSIRGVTVKDAAWRPAPRRHNIWEIVVHAAYWKYVVRRRLRGERRGSFPLPGSNWFSRPISSTESAWQEDRRLLDQEHRKLRVAIKEFFRDRPQRSALALISGIAFHDVYHAGQIRLLRRLRAAARKV